MDKGVSEDGQAATHITANDGLDLTEAGEC